MILASSSAPKPSNRPSRINRTSRYGTDLVELGVLHRAPGSQRVRTLYTTSTQRVLYAAAAAVTNSPTATSTPTASATATKTPTYASHRIAPIHVPHRTSATARGNTEALRARCSYRPTSIVKNYTLAPFDKKLSAASFSLTLGAHASLPTWVRMLPQEKAGYPSFFVCRSKLSLLQTSTWRTSTTKFSGRSKPLTPPPPPHTHTHTTWRVPLTLCALSA